MSVVGGLGIKWTLDVFVRRDLGFLLGGEGEHCKQPGCCQ